MAWGCGFFRTTLAIENRSSEPLTEVRAHLVDEPPRRIDLRDVAPGDRARTVLPGRFGEASLEVEARHGDRPISITCGYLEDAGYRVSIVVAQDGELSCEVRLYP